MRTSLCSPHGLVVRDVGGKPAPEVRAGYFSGTERPGPAARGEGEVETRQRARPSGRAQSHAGWRSAVRS
jgi:hypothetical protein